MVAMISAAEPPVLELEILVLRPLHLFFFILLHEQNGICSCENNVGVAFSHYIYFASVGLISGQMFKSRDQRTL